MRYFSIVIATCFLSLEVFAAISPQREINNWVGRSIFQNSSVAVEMRALFFPHQVYGADRDRLLTPASTYKVVTTATALEILGPDTQFKTTLSYVGVVDTNILRGSLLIIAGGDPTFCSSRTFSKGYSVNPLDRWVAKIKDLGITTIEGDLLIDETIFDGNPYSPKWLMEDLGNYYAAGAHAFAFEDNSYQLRIHSTADRVSMSYSDSLLDSMLWNSKVQIGDRDDLYIGRFGYSNQATLTGTVRANQRSYTVKGDLYHPALFMGWRLRNRLLQQGVRFNGVVKIVDNPLYKNQSIIVDTHYSPQLSEVIQVVNFYSDNLYAEMLLRHIGVTSGQGSIESGIRTLKSYWHSQGIDLWSAQLWDGSGLSPTNRLTASQIGAVLAFMRERSPHSAVFSSSLPLIGRQGSVASLASGGLLEGRCRLKSGSMKGVVAYCGYIEGEHHPYAITIIVNNATVHRSVLLAAIVDLLTKLSSY